MKRTSPLLVCSVVLGIPFLVIWGLCIWEVAR